VSRSAPTPAATALHEAGLTRRSFAVGAALSLAALGSYLAQPRRTEDRLATKKLGDVIPQSIGPWSYAGSADIVDARAEGPQDGYDQVLTRRYRASGLPEVMLLIAYGSTQGGSLQLHRPETCYPAQGFKLSDFSEQQIHPGPRQTVAGRTFTASRDDRIERLVYWTRIAESFPSNSAQEYAAILGSLVKGLIPDGILVRFSTIGPDVPASDQALQTFMAMLLREAVAARPILIGSAMAAALSQTAAARNK
jgi:EpsI family protein